MRVTSTGAAPAIVLASVLAMAGAATAQDPLPSPDANDLGISENDVREEPSHTDDLNNFQHDDPFWSPTDDALILDAYTEERWTGEDLSNIVNRLQHGSNYDDHERFMPPGSTFMAAWWGWWSDHGGGGDLQTDETTSQAAFVGPANGAIDDDDDCESSSWDEFTWRGANDCAALGGHAAYPGDQMYGFVQPGTHWTINQLLLLQGPVETLTDSKSDGDQQPDFAYTQISQGGQGWVGESNRARWSTDASLLISTSVTSAVNPVETGEAGGLTTYDPFTPAGDAADHAVDVDVYTAAHPAVERAYRTAVWDPDTGPNPERGEALGVLHENGPKGWVKDDGEALYHDALQAAADTQSAALVASEPQRGLANDLVQDPFFHEPNQPGDDFNGWATHDPSTSYGGLDGDYYEPGPDQAYPGYQAGERFWFDAQVAMNDFPWWIPIGSIGYSDGAQWTPEVPSTSSPATDAAREDGTSRGPGILFVHAHAGTWFDGSPDGAADGAADGWVGTAGVDGHPYDNGTVQDPNKYQASRSATIPSGASGPEFRGTCGVDVSATLYPTSDTDGDGTKDWGAAGVYVMGRWGDGNPYSNVWSDAVGPAADLVLDPLRESAAGGTVSYMFPQDDDQLSRYRTTGPIEVKAWACHGLAEDVGFHPAMYNIVLPTGTLDFTFKSVAHAELTDSSRVSHHGDNEDDELAGQNITDVDRYGQMTHLLDDVGS